MLNVIIIDDEQAGVRNLELLLRHYVPQVSTINSTTDPVAGVHLVNSLRPDIVFLDINMPTLDGFGVLEKIEHRGFQLIVTTAHSEYGLRALKQNAIDYLLKPVGREHLMESVMRAQGRLMQKCSVPGLQNLVDELLRARTSKVPIPTKERIEYRTHSQIVYVEADGSSSKVALRDESALHSLRSLKEYEALLCNAHKNFIRIHQSFLININYTCRYYKEDGGYIVMEGNKKLPISKFRKQLVLEMINFPGAGL